VGTQFAVFYRQTQLWCAIYLILSLLFVYIFLCGDGYLDGGVTDRREILRGGRYGSRTGRLPFWSTLKLLQNSKF